jgi:hypothetical protein
MFDSQSERAQLDRLLTSRDGVAVVVMAVSLGGLAAGWAGRSLLAGDPLTEQFWLLPVVVGLLTALYAQATQE